MKKTTLAITSDTHVHTTLSRCCRDPRETPENILPLMREKGISVIAFTDHMWNNPDVPPSPWYAPQNGEKLLKLGEKLRHSEFNGIRVLSGCECDMCGIGRFGMTKELAKRFDMVVLATDHFHMRGFYPVPEEPVAKNLARLMMDFFRSGAEAGFANVLAHPFMPLSYLEIYDDVMKNVSYAELFDACSIAAQNGCALEINGSIMKAARIAEKFDIETYMRPFSIAKEAKCRFATGSDSHSLDSFDVYPYIADFADAAGITDADIIKI